MRPWLLEFARAGGSHAAAERGGVLTVALLVCVVVGLSVLICALLAQQADQGTGQRDAKAGVSHIARLLSGDSANELSGMASLMHSPIVRGRDSGMSKVSGGAEADLHYNEDKAVRHPPGSTCGGLPVVFGLIMDEPLTVSVPSEVCVQSQFEIQLSSESGMPLLMAKRASPHASIEIFLGTSGTRLLEITTAQVLVAPEHIVGACQNRRDGLAYEFWDSNTKRVMVVQHQANGRITLGSAEVPPAKFGSAARHPKSEHEEDHYKLEVAPGYDAVLVISVFIAFMVFTPRRSESHDNPQRFQCIGPAQTCLGER